MSDAGPVVAVTVYEDNDSVRMLAFNNGNPSGGYSCLGACDFAPDLSSMATFNLHGLALGPKPNCASFA